MALIEDSMGDPQNARILARACDISYYGEAEAREKFQAELNLQADLISFDNTQAYIAQNDDHVVVAFRGTEAPTSIEGLKDWLLTDAVNLLTVPAGRMGTDFAAAGVGARFHKGFMDALEEIWGSLAPRIKGELDNIDRPLWLTGHSLGGALALLSGWLLRRQFVSVHQIYTFGAPMIGNAEASRAFDNELHEKVFRYVNLLDPVPKLPTISLMTNDYGHCLKEIVLGASDEDDVFDQCAQKAVDGLLDATLIDELWNGVQARVGSHSMTNYMELVSKLA